MSLPTDEQTQLKPQLLQKKERQQNYNKFKTNDKRCERCTLGKPFLVIKLFVN